MDLRYISLSPPRTGHEALPKDGDIEMAEGYSTSTPMGGKDKVSERNDEESPDRNGNPEHALPAESAEVSGVTVPAVSLFSRLRRYLVVYLSKMMGVKGLQPPNTPVMFKDVLVSAMISFIGIMLVSVSDYWYLSRNFHGRDDTPVKMLIGAFGASAVLSFDSCASPFAQPKNLVLGHIVSAFLGVSVRMIGGAFNIALWIQAPMAVALAISGMRILKCVHPPGGASALIGVIGGQAVYDLGFGYVLTCGGAAFMSMCVAVLFNNLVPWRQYPLYWG